MFSQIAQVFSSQGVVRPGIESIPVYGKPKGAASGPKGSASFGPMFDQASAKLELSQQGLEKNAAQASGDAPAPGDASTSEGATEKTAAGPKKADGKPLSEEEQKQVRELEKRDRQVKAHEAAHEANAGGNAKGGAAYEYRTGPDGRQYAVGGHVDIDVSPVQGNPRATLEKALTVQRAALAPADPSGADRSVAAAASQMAMQARKEMAQDPEGQATGADPRRAYSRSASRTGSGLSVYA